MKKHFFAMVVQVWEKFIGSLQQKQIAVEKVANSFDSETASAQEKAKKTQQNEDLLDILANRPVIMQVGTRKVLTHSTCGGGSSTDGYPMKIVGSERMIDKPVYDISMSVRGKTLRWKEVTLPLGNSEWPTIDGKKAEENIVKMVTGVWWLRPDGKVEKQPSFKNQHSETCNHPPYD